MSGLISPTKTNMEESGNRKPLSYGFLFRGVLSCLGSRLQLLGRYVLPSHAAAKRPRPWSLSGLFRHMLGHSMFAVIWLEVVAIK